MRILITAGSTQVPIDQVRCISNIFKGKTGHHIANYMAERHDVTLVTSNDIPSKCKVIRYKTYDQLFEIMNEQIRSKYDVVIHSSAVSDYKVDKIMIPSGGPNSGSSLIEVDSSTKISSDSDEVYIKMVKTEKIISKIKSDWGFEGILVGFKLLVGVSDDKLLSVANNSLISNNANVIVANCLEWSTERAYIVSRNQTINVTRDNLPKNLLEQIEKI